jgi:hypothetical protein
MPLLVGDGLLAVALIVLWVFCIVDVIRSPELAVRHLPKLVWLVVVLVLPDVGSIVWLVLGRPQGAGTRREPRHGHMDAFPEYDRPGRFRAANPEDDAEFLLRLRERAEDQRRRAAEQRRIAEQRESDERARRDTTGGGTQA